jgi:N-acetylmuramoyl-L-alanine amidase
MPDTPICALVIGHHEEAPGATSVDGTTEYDYNTDLSARIARRVDPSECKMVRVRRVEPYVMPYEQVNGIGCDFAVSLHFNSFDDRSAEGCEVLHWHSSEEGERFAQILKSHIRSALRVKDRGLKPIYDGDRGAPILQYTTMPVVLAEPGFGSNHCDWRQMDRHRDYLAGAYANAIMQYARHISSSTA